MATKAEKKAAAREARIERERAAAEAARRRTRLIQVATGIVVVIVLVAVVIAVTSGGGSNSPATSAKASSSVTKLLAGIPQNGSTLGQASAPVTVTLYEDLECPVCRAFTLDTESKLIANDVRPGTAKLVFRSLQTATGDSQTFQFQQQAAVAAGLQNKLWHFVELFYHQQGAEGTPYVTESYIDKLARQVPALNYNAWLSARKGARVAAPVASDIALAQTKHYSSTPTIVVSGPKGEQQAVAGAASYSSVKQLITKAGG